jgi:hypothetical protein
MNAVVDEKMTLEEMMEAVNKAMAENSIAFNKKNGRPLDAPVDPADAASCEGCQ